MDPEDLVLHLHGVDPGLEIGLHLVLVARVRVDDVPVAGTAEGVPPLPFDLRSGVGAGRLRRGGGVAGGNGGHGIDREVAVALRRLVREVFGLDDLFLVRCRLGHEFEPDLVGRLLDDGRLDHGFRHDLLGRRVVAGRREDLRFVDGLCEHRLRGLVRGLVDVGGRLEGVSHRCVRGHDRVGGLLGRSVDPDVLGLITQGRTSLTGRARGRSPSRTCSPRGRRTW